jgi:hypothetical protein
VIPVFVEPSPQPEHSVAINRSYLSVKIDNQRGLFLFQGFQKLVGVRA